jgi:hypothetical protein
LAYYGAAFKRSKPWRDDRETMRLKSRCSIFAIFLYFLSTGVANSQFNQYTPPGGPQERPEDRETRLKRELAEARYHFGPIRIAPEAGIKDVAYVRNLFTSGGETASDVTATVAAGGRGYLHTGPKIVWIARVRPEYVWWHQRTAARRFNLNSGIEGLGFFNRLFVGVSATRSEQQRILTPEVPQLGSGRSDELQATAELRLTGALYTFLTARGDQQKNLADDLVDPAGRQLSLLDRKETVERGGLRWRPFPGYTLGVGAEHSQVGFDRKVLDSSNAGTAPILEMLVDRRRFFFQVDAADRSLTARQGSRFIDFHGITGSIGASYRPQRSLEVWTYANRNVVYSLSPLYPYLDDSRVGIALGVGAGKRLVSRFFAETGQERYKAFSAAEPQRRDDVRSFGGSLRLLVSERVTVVAQVTRSRYSSNVPGNDRSYTSGGLSVTLGNYF